MNKNMKLISMELSFLIMILSICMIVISCTQKKENGLVLETKEPEQDPFMMGESLMAHGKYSEAIINFQKALESKPDEVSILVSLGFCLIKIQNFEKASSIFRKIIFIDKYFKEAYLGLAVSYYFLGDIQESRNVVQEGLKLLPPGEERENWKNLLKARLPGLGSLEDK
jgi:tetratricopeptide (TPR) repeat protein